MGTDKPGFSWGQAVPTPGGDGLSPPGEVRSGAAGGGQSPPSRSRALVPQTEPAPPVPKDGYVKEPPEGNQARRSGKFTQQKLIYNK
jgi:hypothetical protein